MAKSVAEISAKVVSVLPLVNFEGEAILTHFDPRYVVALKLNESRHDYKIHGTDVVLPAHDVAFFAIHSVTQLFMTSDVVGESFRIHIEVDTVEGSKRYSLRLVS
jgi:hypothetical protein